MKRWQETSAILESLVELFASGRSGVVAMVVRIQGSSYRRPGARVLVDDRGTLTGNVSGGCLEEDLRERGHRMAAGQGGAAVVQYKTGGEDRVWGLGLGCDGVIDVLLQPWRRTTDSEPALRLMAMFDAGQPFHLTTVVSEGPELGKFSASVAGGPSIGTWARGNARGVSSGEATNESAYGLRRIEGIDVLVESFEPPPPVLVVGAGDDAIPLVALLSTMGFRVVVADHRRAYLTRDRFPQAGKLLLVPAGKPPEDLLAGRHDFAVLMTHSLSQDRSWLQFLLPKSPKYIGLLGPSGRRDELLGSVVSEGRPTCLYGPMGLDLGGEGPEHVAVSIAAEILAVYHGRSGGHLRERAAGLHRD